jgi:hypothetical protein
MDLKCLTLPILLMWKKPYENGRNGKKKIPLGCKAIKDPKK